jgi:hypothetical protein
MYIRGFNSLAAIFLFFLLHAMSCTFSNSISFSLLSLVPSLPVLVLVLLSLRVPVLVMPSSHPSHIPVRITKSHVSCYALPLYRVTVLPKSTPAPKVPSTPHHKFLGFHSYSLPICYTSGIESILQEQARLGRIPLPDSDKIKSESQLPGPLCSEYSGRGSIQ